MLKNPDLPKAANENILMWQIKTGPNMHRVWKKDLKNIKALNGAAFTDLSTIKTNYMQKIFWTGEQKSVRY